MEGLDLPTQLMEKSGLIISTIYIVFILEMKVNGFVLL
jgi:hypothetical protein